QWGKRVEPESVDPEIEPETHGAQDRFQHLRIVEVQIRLVTEEPGPVVRLRDAVPCPGRGFSICKYDARAGVLIGIVAPDVVIALERTFRCAARGLEPWMLVR